MFVIKNKNINKYAKAPVPSSIAQTNSFGECGVDAKLENIITKNTNNDTLPKKSKTKNFRFVRRPMLIPKKLDIKAKFVK